MWYIYIYMSYDVVAVSLVYGDARVARLEYGVDRLWGWGGVGNWGIGELGMGGMERVNTLIHT
jgi:hypothetical protein